MSKRTEKIFLVVLGIVLVLAILGAVIKIATSTNSADQVPGNINSDETAGDDTTEDETEEDTIVVETLDPALEIISFQDIGIRSGLYTYATNETSQGTYNGSLDGKVLDGYITFSEKRAGLIIGGTDTSNGIEIYSSPDGYLGIVNLYTKETIRKVIEGVVDTSLRGTEFHLQLSFQLEDQDNDGKKNDLKLGIWINEVLYENKYVYLKDYETDGVSNLGNSFRVWCGEVDRYVRIRTESAASRGATELDSTLKKISFCHFGINDGRYKKTGTDSNAVKGYYGKGLNGTVLDGYVVFSQKTAYLTFGANKSMQGLELYSLGDSNLGLKNMYTKKDLLVISPELAGTTLCENKIHLQLSMQMVNDDGLGGANDLKLGIWIDEKLYLDEYIYIHNYGSDDDNSGLGGYMRVYCSENDRYVSLISIYDTPKTTDKLDSNFKFITFDDFGIESKIYTKTGKSSTISGFYDGQMNGTVLEGDVLFSKGEAKLVFGDAKGSQGLQLGSCGGSNLKLVDMSTKEVLLVLTPEAANTALCGKDFNLKISIQLIDKDKDGAEDDLKLGIWINDVLYLNEYVYINNYGEGRLGGYLGVTCPQLGNFVKLKSTNK